LRRARSTIDFSTMVYVGARALAERWREGRGETEKMENGKWRMEN
jgi:hypothetical protein